MLHSSGWNNSNTEITGAVPTVTGKLDVAAETGVPLPANVMFGACRTECT